VSNLSEQNLDGLPYHYGFDNLNSRSVSLADGTQRRYYVLPEDYPLKQTSPPMSLSAREKVSVMAQSSAAGHAASLATVPCSKANITASSESILIHNLQVPTTMQDGSSVFKEMAVYDVYEEDMTACRRCLRPAVYIIEIDSEEVEVKVDSDKPTISLERPTDSIFSFANEKKFDTELLAVCPRGSGTPPCCLSSRSPLVLGRLPRPQWQHRLLGTAGHTLRRLPWIQHPHRPPPHVPLQQHQRLLAKQMGKLPPTSSSTNQQSTAELLPHLFSVLC
jgi:hypothetical protein